MGISFDNDVMNRRPRYATNVYVASSWRNQIQPEIVHHLRKSDYKVYDFKNPPGRTGFSWKEVDPNYVHGTKIGAEQYRCMLDTPEAERGYQADISALESCQICLLVLPAGKSAAWEYGFAHGRGKYCGVIWFGEDEPDLMFKGTPIIASLSELDSFMVNYDS